MNNLRIQNRLYDKKDKLFYVIYDTETRNYYDLMEFRRFEDVPILERTIFKCFSQTFNNLFESKDYNFNFFKVNMFLTYNIELKGESKQVKEIEYKISTILKEIYLSLRWQDLFNLINSFRGKTTIDGVEGLKTFLLNQSLKDFSKQTNDAFNKLKLEINYHGKDEDLLKECIMLVIYDEYKRALIRTQNIGLKITELKKKLDLNKPINEEDIKLIDEICDVSNEEII